MSATRCAPTPECVAAVRAFADGRQRAGFWVEGNRALKYITMQLPNIFDHALLYGTPEGTDADSGGGGSERKIRLHRRPAMVDLGAGMYGKENSPDDSDALALLAGFQTKVDVHAFEARPDKAEGLVLEAKRRNSTAPYAERRLFVHAMGAAATAGKLRFANCGGSTNWMIVAPNADAPRGCHIRYEVPVTSLDELARSGVLRGRRLVYVKVDVEGSEVDVAKGMAELLASQRIELMSFEYAKNWNIPLFIDAQRGQGRRLNGTQLEALYRDPVQMERTLESFQATMDRFGYDTYLLHGGAARSPKAKLPALTHADGPHNTPWRATLVPVHAPFFDRATFEICLRRHHFKQSWCWNDLLVVRRANTALKRRLFDVFHGGQQPRPFARCNESCI